MGAFIARQPNGLLCRFSTVTDCITNYNMTEENYIDLCVEKAREEAKNTIENGLYPFGMVNAYFRPYSMKRKEHKAIMEKMKKPPEGKEDENCNTY